MSGDWLEVVRWEEFQHYAERDPIWIKDYVRQLHQDNYLSLTLAERGLLQGLRLLYADTRRELRLDTARITRALNARTSNTQLLSLKDAGFIDFRASKPLALARARVEKEVEKDPPNPPNGGAPKLSQKQLRKFTGCRQTRGSHGFGFVRDPLGTDKPPADWPFERPTKEEVGAALAATSHGGGEQPPEGE